jgi:hypothetical protein
MVELIDMLLTYLMTEANIEPMSFIQICLMGFIVYYQYKGLLLNKTISNSLSNINNTLNKKDETFKQNIEIINNILNKLVLEMDLHQKEETQQHNDIGKTVNVINRDIGIIGATLNTSLSLSKGVK